MTTLISKPAALTLAFTAALLMQASGVASAASNAQATTPAAAATPPANTAKPAAATANKPIKLFQDWGVACEAQADKSQKCFIQQNQFMTKGGQRLINVNVGYLGPKGQAMVVAFLPLGIDLKKGAWIKFESGPQVPLSIETCAPEGCRATAALDTVALSALRTTKAIGVWFKAYRDERQMNVAISVKGLPQALAALKP